MRSTLLCNNAGTKINYHIFLAHSPGFRVRRGIRSKITNYTTHFQQLSFHFSLQGGQQGDHIDPNELTRLMGPQWGATLQIHVQFSFADAIFRSSQHDLHDLRYQVLNQEATRKIKEG